jgi:hypothetical protein
VRVVLGVGFGFFLGLVISRRPKYWLILAATFLGVLLSVTATYLYLAYLNQTIDIVDFRAFFKYKSALTYFLAWPMLFGFGAIFYESSNLVLNRKLEIYFFLSFLCYLICIYAAHSLNGFLIAAFSFIIYFTFHLIKFFRFSGNNLKGLLRRASLNLLMTLLIVAVASIAFLSYDQVNESKLVNLIGDIKTSISFRDVSAWKLDEHKPVTETPLNSVGNPINSSTYERVTWFFKGLQLIRENPLGAGFTHLSFSYFMGDQNSSYGFTKTHSGWLDFALGVGIPGMVFIWASFLIIGIKGVRFSRSKSGLHKTIATQMIFSIFVIWCLWWISELSEREFIENYLFMMSIFCGYFSFLKPLEIKTSSSVN